MKKLILLLSLIFTSFIALAEPPATQTDTKTANNFGIHLYQELVSQNIKENIAVSPFGVTSLLNILYLCTAGNTQQEIAKQLGLSSELDNQYYITQLPKSLTNSTSTNQFTFGNALWIQSGLPLNKTLMQKFKDYNISYYDVDYIHNKADTIKRINTWVANLTNQLILNLIRPDMVTEDTKLIATNVIYFKGLWENAFDSSRTKLDTFTLNNGQSKNVPMMSQSDSFAYAENDDMQMVIMPYKDSNLAMAAILPKEKNHFEQFYKSFNIDKILQLVNNANATKVRISLPKFTIESDFYSMEDNLKNLGIKQIFDKYAANFSPLTNYPLYLFKVVQKTYVQVDEKGTTAAAATAGVILAGAAPTTPILAKFDHPFIFVIFDTKTKLILFIGNVMNP